jgi:hypothetical protein
MFNTIAFKRTAKTASSQSNGAPELCRGKKFTDVSEEYSTSIFKVEE